METSDAKLALPLTHLAGLPSNQNDEPRRTPVTFGGRLPALAQGAFIVCAVLAFAYFARVVVVPVLAAWVISMTLKPPVRWLRLRRMPAPLAAGVIVILVVTAIATGLVHLGRPAVQWLQAAPENVPRLKEKFRHVLRPAIRLSEAAATVGSSLSSSETSLHAPQPVEVQAGQVPSVVFTWTGSLLVGIGETVALVFLLLATGDGFAQKLLRAMPSVGDKKQAFEISQEIQQNISRYLFTVGLVNTGFGLAVGLALSGLGMPNAIMWGGVAALLNFVPYFGPVALVGLVTLAGLIAFDTLANGLAPAGACLLLHLLEANAITPFVLGKRFTLNPVIVFVTLMFCIWIWGITGALLAVPLLVTLKVVCDRVPPLGTLGTFLSPREPAARTCRPA